MTMCDQDDDDSSIPEDWEWVASTLDCELIRCVFKMPRETRAKLLGFLHLAGEAEGIKGDLFVDASGHAALSLFNQKGPDEDG